MKTPLILFMFVVTLGYVIIYKDFIRLIMKPQFGFSNKQLNLYKNYLKLLDKGHWESSSKIYEELGDDFWESYYKLSKKGVKKLDKFARSNVFTYQQHQISCTNSWDEGVSTYSINFQYLVDCGSVEVGGCLIGFFNNNIYVTAADGIDLISYYLNPERIEKLRRGCLEIKIEQGHNKYRIQIKDF